MTLLQSLFRTQEPSVLDISIKTWIEEQEQAMRDGYQLYRQYYRGDHRTLLTDRLRKFIPQDIKFRDNFCDVVIDVAAERLTVIGFDAGDDKQSDALWQWWQSNRMDFTQKVIHAETMMLGDGFVIVEWDNEAKHPVFKAQDSQMMLARYVNGKLDFISKKWVEQKVLGDKFVTNLNLYYPDRIEKYQALGGVWQQRLDEGETGWPVSWVGKSGQPLGIPVIHFRNRPLGDDYGTSELVDIIPLQDLLNKSLIDLMQILDTQAFAQRWALGVSATASDKLDVTPGAVWVFGSEEGANVQIGQFEAANIDGPLKAMETLIQHIAGQSRTPQHVFHISGAFPSGEALKTSESGLVKKVRERQVNFGNGWEDMMLMAVKLDEAFGSGKGFGEHTIQALWDDPETRNERDHLEGLKLKAELGVTRDQIYREMGYSQEEIDRMEEDRTTERVSETNIGAEILRNFQQGI